MKKHTTEIAFILDRSGSMASLNEAPIAAFNEFLQTQQNVPGAARMTLGRDCYGFKQSPHSLCCLRTAASTRARDRYLRRCSP